MVKDTFTFSLNTPRFPHCVTIAHSSKIPYEEISMCGQWKDKMKWALGGSLDEIKPNSFSSSVHLYGRGDGFRGNSSLLHPTDLLTSLSPSHIIEQMDVYSEHRILRGAFPHLFPLLQVFNTRRYKLTLVQAFALISSLNRPFSIST